MDSKTILPIMKMQLNAARAALTTMEQSNPLLALTVETPFNGNPEIVAAQHALIDAVSALEAVVSHHEKFSEGR